MNGLVVSFVIKLFKPPTNNFQLQGWIDALNSHLKKTFTITNL